MAELTKVEIKMQVFLGKRLTGSASAIKQHKVRANVIARNINERFGKNVYQYQVKHFRWFLEYNPKKLSSGVLYKYWLSIKLIIKIMVKSEHWLPLLQGSWQRPIKH